MIVGGRGIFNFLSSHYKNLNGTIPTLRFNKYTVATKKRLLPNFRSLRFYYRTSFLEKRPRYSNHEVKDFLLSEEEEICEIVERKKSALLKEFNERGTAPGISFDVSNLESIRNTIQKYIESNVSLADTQYAMLLFTNAIVLAIQKDDIELMDELVIQMENLDLPLTIDIYHLILMGYCKKGRISSMTKHLSIMYSKDMVDLFTFHLIIITKMKMGGCFSVNEICPSIGTIGTGPTIETCNLLLYSYILNLADPWIYSKDVWGVIAQNRLAPTSETYELFIESSIFHFHESISNFSKFEEDVKLKAVEPTNGVLAALVLVLITNRRHDEAEKMLLEYPKKYGITLSSENIPSRFVVDLLKGPKENRNAFDSLYEYSNSQSAETTLTLKIIKHICKILLALSRDEEAINSLKRWIFTKRNNLASEMERREFAMQVLLWKEVYTYENCIKYKNIPPPTL